MPWSTRPGACSDEPTGALNSASGLAVLDSFRKINANGQTILMATHEVRSACIGDRIIYLKDDELQSEYRLDNQTQSIEDREAAVLQWLSSQGW